MNITNMEIRILLAFFVIQVLAYANSTGMLSDKKEYIIGIPDSLRAQTAIQLHISSAFPTSFHVEAPFIGYNYSHLLRQNSISLSLSAQLQMQESSVARKAVYIQSEHAIFVHVIIVEAFSSDGFLAVPLQTESTEYYALTYKKNTNQITLAVLLDNTNIQIYIKLSTGSIYFNGKTFTDGQTIHETLNKYDVLQLQSSVDLTGTYIKSSQPISVLSGTRCLAIQGYCDVTIVQLKPIAEWRTEFLISGFENDLTTVTKIVAAEANTTVKINGKYVGSVSQGEYIERLGQSSSLEFVQASKPVEIVQYHDIRGSDVFMLNIPAIDQFMTYYIFEVSSDFPNNYLELYIDTRKIDGILLNDVRVTVTNHTNIYATSVRKSFSVCTLTVATGKHKLAHTDADTRFGAVLYGTGKSISYGFFLGYSNGPVCTPPCKNEATCIADNTCHCPLGYRGQRCELGHALAEDLKPKLFPLIDGTDDNFMDPLAWHSNPPFSDSNKVCYVKILVKNSSVDTVLSAVSSTVHGEIYGNFTSGVIDATSGLTGSVRFGCLEVRCPFVTTNGVYSYTTVAVSVDGQNNGTCVVSNYNQHIFNFTVQSYNGKSDEIEFTLEVGKNYGPYYGVYMAIGNRNKAKFIAEHKCNSGREFDYHSYNPSVGVLAEYTC